MKQSRQYHTLLFRGIFTSIDKDTSQKHGKLHWHPAFLQAIQLELFDYRDLLEFKYEYQLTSEPLRIDLLIIKKPKDVTIDKNIARVFKTDNIIEYKSPDDYLSVKDFLKVYAYANLYAAITPNVELSDITITFVENRYPRKLLEYLTDTRHYRIEESAPGIYRVSGDYIPIQIIESKKLPEIENLWLKSLTNDLELRNASAILEAGKKRIAEAPLGAYLDILLRANPEVFLEARTMATSTGRTFEEVFTEAGIIPQWIEQGRAQGMEQGRAQGMEQGMEIAARNALARGIPIETVHEITGLDTKTIMSLQTDGKKQ